MTTQSGSAERTMPEPEDLARTLVDQLSDPDGRKRFRARIALEDMGPSAVPALVAGLHRRDRHVRWEAAKALGKIADPSTVNPLLDVLLDDVPEIRWVAAEALAAIGWPSVEPLLHMLIREANRPMFRNVTHFVLRTIEGRDGGDVLQPVLHALQGVEPSMEAPIAAQNVLIRLMNERFRAA